MQQPVIWTFQDHSGVVPLIAVPPSLTGEDQPPPTLAVSDAIPAHDGQHIRFRAGDVDIQIVILRGTAPAAPLAAVIPLDADGLDRLGEVERFWRALHGRASQPEHRLTEQQRRRLRLMLRAVDGRTHEASYREIAEVLFGPDRIADHPWKSSPWRDRVYRLVRDGRAMIAGGYRKLLRLRRRK